MSNRKYVKKTKMIKRITALLSVVIFSVNSFAAIVSDNDGTAFVTKGEFDALKNNFSKQIDDYKQSITDKMDGAISEYLSGVRLDMVAKKKYLCADVGTDVLMMLDNDKLRYKYNHTSGTFNIRARREFGTNPSYTDTILPMYSDTDPDRDKGYYLGGSVWQKFTVAASNNGHRTIIRTDNTDDSDTTGEWVGYTETAQDTLTYNSTVEEYSMTGIVKKEYYTDGTNKVYSAQVPVSTWGKTGYDPNYQLSGGGLYGQFTDVTDTHWLPHTPITKDQNVTFANWSSNYGTIKNTTLCVWDPEATGDFTVENNYRWQRTPGKVWPSGDNYYGTTQAWITEMMKNCAVSYRVSYYDMNYDIKQITNYGMAAYDGTSTSLGGTNQWYTEKIGNVVDSSDTGDAWVPALGFHSGITKWKQLYQNSLQNINLLQSDGSYVLKDKIYLTEGLPLFEVKKDAKEYNFTLEFDTTGIKCYFTFDPGTYSTVSTSKEPLAANLVPVYMDGSTVSSTSPTTTKTVTKFTIKPEKSLQGTLFVKWTKATPVSGKYNGGGTLKLGTYNTADEVLEG